MALAVADTSAIRQSVLLSVSARKTSLWGKYDRIVSSRIGRKSVSQGCQHKFLAKLGGITPGYTAAGLWESEACASRGLVGSGAVVAAARHGHMMPTFVL